MDTENAVVKQLRPELKYVAEKTIFASLTMKGEQNEKSTHCRTQ